MTVCLSQRFGTTKGALQSLHLLLMTLFWQPLQAALKTCTVGAMLHVISFCYLNTVLFCHVSCTDNVRMLLVQSVAALNLQARFAWITRAGETCKVAWAGRKCLWIGQSTAA